jgi:ABC-2 type transport system permease protein
MIGKYLSLWFSFFRMSWMENLEYRLNFVFRVFTELLWYSAQIAVFEVIYVHTSSIAGWDIHDVRVFMGTLFMLDCLWMIFFNENFDQFSEVVKKGDLDLLLTKPVDAQFMVTMRRSNPIYVVNFILVSVYFAWAISGIDREIALLSWVKYVALFFCGLSVIYSLRMFFAALVLVVHNASSLTYVWYQFYRLGTRPHSLYPVWLRAVVTFIFPVGLIVSVPSYHLLFESDVTLFTTPLIAVFLLWLSRKAWLGGLKRYASASS